MSATVIANLVLQYGLPFATQLVERWTKEEPDNPKAADWLAFLQSHHSLVRTYDQQIQAAEARAGV